MTNPPPEAPAAVPFDLGSTPLLAGGQSRVTLVKGERLTSHLMVIAEGGESTLHAHRNEEHIFLVLAGQARFQFLPPQDPVRLEPLQGILIPADCFYSYCSVGEQNLVFVRVGSTRGSDAARVGLDGLPVRGKSPEAGWRPGVPDPSERRLGDLFSPSELN
jgi:quercetin dioxygenase-like cupin family protein